MQLFQMIWAKSPQIESATGQQTKGFEVFLIAWSKADSLLKDKRFEVVKCTSSLLWQ